jgi:hypothetical protein
MLGAWAFGAGLAVTLLYGVYSLVLAVLYLAFAFGMWNLAPWAWTVGILTTILSVLWALYGVLVVGNVGALVALVASCVILWYLFQPRVKGAFGRS